MKIQLILATMLLAGSTTFAADVKTGPDTNAVASFNRLKTLVGEWESKTDKGTARVSYELIAGGSTLVERFQSEKEPEMLTVYHIDGKRLILTHYCSMGNQPRMQATSFNPETGELQFQFLDATNLTSPGEGHMHNARIRLIDDRHMVSEWQFYEKGEPKFTENARYTRVK